MNKNLSDTFALLRFPLAIMVIFLHISPVISTFDSSVTGFDESSRVYYYLNMTINKVATCAVPTFFSMSGYLLVFNIRKLTLPVYLYKIRNRIKTLFLPYVLWNILAALYLYVTSQHPFKFTFQELFIEPANFPLWFLRDLIIMVISFPVFYILAKVGKGGVFLIAICLFMLLPMTDMHMKYTLIPGFFFYIGIYCGYRQIHLDSFDTYTKIIAVSLFLITLCVECFFKGYIAWRIDNSFLILGVISILLIGHSLVVRLNWRSAGFLSMGSFFIYCSHKVGPTFLAKSLIGLFPISPCINDIIIFLVSPLLTCIICMLIYRFGKNHFPAVMNLLTGGK